MSNTEQHRWISPLTLTEVPYEYEAKRRVAGNMHFEGSPYAICFQHEKFRICIETGNISVQSDHPYMRPANNFAYTRADLRHTWSLIRSKALNGSRNYANPIMVLSEMTYKDSYLVKPELWTAYNVLSFEREFEEAKALSFAEKASKTLENLYDAWSDSEQALELDFSWALPDGVLYFEFDPKAPVQWLAYGCDLRQAYLVYRFLFDEGYIRFLVGTKIEGTRYRPNGLEVTASGLQRIEEIRNGRDPFVRQVFFVRRYGVELDAVIAPLIEEIERAACKIRAVWQIVHNRKIDEYVLRLIRESGVILLWVDPDNFNVGLEAGYSLALNKPIVAFRRKPVANRKTAGQELPFDIRTLNTFEFEEDKPEDFTRVISERIRAGFEELKLRQPNSRI